MVASLLVHDHEIRDLDDDAGLVAGVSERVRIGDIRQLADPPPEPHRELAVVPGAKPLVVSAGGRVDLVAVGALGAEIVVEAAAFRAHRCQ